MGYGLRGFGSSKGSWDRAPKQQERKVPLGNLATGAELEATGRPSSELLRSACVPGFGLSSVVLCPKTPSIQIRPTLGSKVYTYYLLWAVWSLRVCISASRERLDRQKCPAKLRILNPEP